MKIRTLISAIAISLCISAIGFAEEAKKAPVYKTPQEAIKAWLGAFETGDLKTFESVVLVSESNKEYFKLTLKSAAVNNQFVLKMTEKFGADFAKGSVFEADMKKRAEHLKIQKVENFVVEELAGKKFIYNKKSKRKIRYQIVQQNGSWKLDMRKIKTPKLQPIIRAYMKANRDAIEEATESIGTVEGQTSKEILDAMQKRIHELTRKYVQEAMKKRNPQKGD